MNIGNGQFLQDEARVHLLEPSQEEDSFTVSIMPATLPNYLSEIDRSGTRRGELELSERTPKQSISHNKRRCCQRPFVLICGAATLSALGGLLFGYDIGIISGALLQLRPEFCLSCQQAEVVVGTMLGGAILASLTGGFLVDYFGRRVTIMVNSCIFILGAVILSSASSFTVLIVGRIIVGYAVALSVIAECVYISEISPHKTRGMLVSLNELGIVIGFLVAFIVNFAFIQMENGWRYMFGLSIIPAVIQGAGMCFLPSSPRFLISKHREQEAREVLHLLHGNGNVDEELENIKKALKDEMSHSFLDLFRSQNNMRYRMFIGMGLVFLQQFTGQPNVLYYAPTIFQSIGFHSDTAATLAAVGLGVTKVAACVLALFLLDRVGRRKLLLVGTFLMAVSIIALGLSTLSVPKMDYVNPCSLSNVSHCNQPVEGNQINSTSIERQTRSLYDIDNKSLVFPGVPPSKKYKDHQSISTDFSKTMELKADAHSFFSPGQNDQNTHYSIYDITEKENDLIKSILISDKISDFNKLFSGDKNHLNRNRVVKRDMSEVVLDAGEGDRAISYSASAESGENLMPSPTQPKVNMMAKWAAMLSLVAFVGTYEIGFGAGTWLVLAEIFPSAVRGRAIAIATVFNWGTNLLVSCTFLDIIDAVGVSWTFLPYGVISVLAAGFIYLFIPETKGKTLEQIGQDFGKWSCVSQLPCCREVQTEHGNGYRIMDVDEDNTVFMDEDN